MYQNNFLRKPACHGHNLHLRTEPQVLRPENSRLDRMNTPNTRPITSSLALNRLGSLCMREFVGLCHDALIWKTSKKLLKFKTQDQGWRNSELNLFEFEHLKRWLCSIWWNGQNIDRRARILSWNRTYPVACRPIQDLLSRHTQLYTAWLRCAIQDQIRWSQNCSKLSWVTVGFQGLLAPTSTRDPPVSWHWTPFLYWGIKDISFASRVFSSSQFSNIL